MSERQSFAFAAMDSSLDLHIIIINLPATTRVNSVTSGFEEGDSQSVLRNSNSDRKLSTHLFGQDILFSSRVNGYILDIWKADSRLFL